MWRNSLLVGGATFLVGSALMQIGDNPKGEIGWWPYVGTFISGALGFMLVANPHTPKMFELNAEGPTDDELESWSERQDDGSMLVTIDEDGDSHTELTYDEEGDLTDLKRFMAELFEAEKKHRRRTTFAWTRGMEEGFVGDDGKVNHEEKYGYSHPYNFSSYTIPDYAYHIDNLPEGYHLHLWKPQSKKRNWTMYYKSPNSDVWKRIRNRKKRMMKEVALDLYNTDIAKPAEYDLSPIERMMLQQGMKLDTGLITRSEIENAQGRGEIKIIWYYSPPNTEPKPFCQTIDARTGVLSYVFNGEMPKELRNFWRGMRFLGFEKAGSVRSVNRYNTDRKQWVASHPAWFRNLCAQGITKIHITQEGHDYKINDRAFMRFNNITNPSRGFQIRDTDGGWIVPRQSTQRKMLEQARDDEWEMRSKFKQILDSNVKKEDWTPSSSQIAARVFYQCVRKYNPQDDPRWHTSFTHSKLADLHYGFVEKGHPAEDILTKTGEYMARRFKKK